MIEILQRWAGGEQPTSEELEKLAEEECRDRGRMAAFGIGPEGVGEVIRRRSQLFQSLLRENPDLPILSEQLKTLWTLWLPLGIQLAELRQTLGRPPVQGILGGQGTGKTTLATVLSRVLALLDYRTLSLSIDDLYKTYDERQRLREADPRLIWRGPPGTHDVDLGISVLDRLRHPASGERVAVPRFDKSLWNGGGDRTEPEWVTGIDVVLFEGWFVGSHPVDGGIFETAPAPIVTESDRQFAREMNHKLQDYLPLWERLDRLMVLNPVDYRLSKQWRRQAENEMKAKGRSGMTDGEIEQFVDYFWKSLHPELFILPLVEDRDRVDLVVDIEADHSVGRVYRPGAWD
ncbi:glycerate kinase [Lyngbya sp. CCY1209]|uniref:glycerate kinase n=1 Tax=Lyngbya sp. CCY1209 TaxID=2886103 RepID=UPI002D20BA42|nr:glycerate kinase [Lyngbya sp. CCY1209]MEB3887104.1 glycerate kinase [Lyngbya sp. CCY1209]